MKKYLLFIVSQSLEYRIVYRHFLENNQEFIYKILEFDSVEKILKYLTGNLPDLILLDYSLPDISALDFLDKLKRIAKNKLIPVIVLSAQGDEATAVEIMRKGAWDYLMKARLTSEALNRSISTAIERLSLMRQIEQKQEQQQLLGAIALRIRQSLSLDKVLNTAVEEIRKFLETDRMLVYQFCSDGNGSIVAESILPGWEKLLNVHLKDCYFYKENSDLANKDSQKSYQLDKRVTNNIDETEFSQYHLQMLEKFQVKANLIVPILSCNDSMGVDDSPDNNRHKLWGLLIAHQCSEIRQWRKEELDLLEQLSVQLAIAIRQAELYENLQSLNNQLEVKVEERTQKLQQSESKLQEFNQKLEIRVQERTNDLEQLNIQLRREIDERQRITDELRESEAKFRQLAENIREVFFIYNDNASELIYISPAYEEIWGSSSSDLHENPLAWLDLVHPEDKKALLIALSRQLKTDGLKHEFRIIRKDGEIRWIFARTFLVRDKNAQVQRIVGIGKDISDRKQAELEIIRNRDLREAIFNESADAIFLVDQETNLTVDCNRRTLELFEAQDKQQLIDIEAQTLQKHEFTPEEIQIAAEEILNKGFWSKEVEYNTCKGNMFWGNLAVKQINVAQKVMNLIRVSDISEQQAALREREIREKQIQRSLEEKETLLKEIHHRVKNNLQIISSLLRMQSRRILDEKTLILFQEAQNRVQSMALIHEQLYYSDDISQIDFGEYISSLMNNLFRCYGVNEKKIVINIETNNLQLNLDNAIPCGLIINELVSNSFKYAFPNGMPGKISIIIQECQNSKNDLLLIISDTGIGISNTLKWEESNSLGLKIVRSLTRQLKGNISLNCGQGANFQIIFPKSIH